MTVEQACPHPDWRVSYLPGAGQPINGPLGARRLLPVCTDCGEPVVVGVGTQVDGRTGPEIVESNERIPASPRTDIGAATEGEPNA